MAFSFLRFPPGFPPLGELSRRAKLGFARRRSAAAGLLGRWVEAERGRFFLFLPWLIAAGIVAWFAAPLKISHWPLFAGCAAAAAGWLWCGQGSRTGAASLLLIVAAFLFGGGLIALRTDLLDATLVPAGPGARTVTGSIELIEVRDKDRRYTVRVQTIEGVEKPPAKVRVVWRGDPGDAAPGDLIRMRSVLSPPPGPALPGGYDFSRSLIYRGIGATGFSYTAPEVLARTSGGLRPFIESRRDWIAARAETIIGGSEGGVAAALLTGKRERVDEADVGALREAGLAHLLAISGLHMGLFCGTVFWTSRFLLTRSERAALSLPTKKLAALAALVAGGVYLALSGSAWSAQRAYIMAATVFTAILMDRQALSMRNVSLAALIVLIYRPEAVLSPGFQMSFAAVVTLVSAYQALEKIWPRHNIQGPVGKARSFVLGLLLTSVLAGLATAPFALYNFGQAASYGLLGNMLAMPIVTVAVMPALVLSLFLMPFGVDAPVLFLVGEGLGLVLKAAHFVSSLPGSAYLVPQLPALFIILSAGGLLLLGLLQAPWRFGGAALLVAAALAAQAPVRSPALFVSRDLSNVGAPRANGEMVLLSVRRDKFSIEAWQQALGRPKTDDLWSAWPACRRSSCLVLDDQVAIIGDRTELRRTCSRAVIVVMRARSLPGDEERCAAKLFALDENGSHPPFTLHRQEGGFTVTEAAQFKAP